MSHKKETPNKEELQEQYNQSGVSISELARIYCTSNPTVRKWLIDYGIERKSHKEASQQANKKNAKSRISENSLLKLSDKNWLFDQRIIQRKSIENIAESLGISIAPVTKWIKYHNIPHIRLNESEHTTKMLLGNKEYIQDIYDKGNKLQEIADLLGTSKATVSKFMQKHGIITRNPNSYERNHKKISIGELEVLDYVKSIRPDLNIVSNGVGYIGKELDILIPELKFAIEYNGLYYHTEEFKEKLLHFNKTNLCADRGIFLLHVWEDDWKFQKDKIKSMISNKLQGTKEKIFARKCEIKEIIPHIAKDFANKNHIQSYSKSSVNLGLYNQGSLVAVMTFNKPRFNKKYDWELVRYCTILNTNVVGGFSKLLSYFRKSFSGSIVSYADRSYSDGNVYIKNGFKKSHENPPSYWYVIDHYSKRVPRTQFTKSKLKDFDQNMSEKQITKLLNIGKIWNCGTITFVLE